MSEARPNVRAAVLAMLIAVVAGWWCFATYVHLQRAPRNLNIDGGVVVLLGRQWAGQLRSTPITTTPTSDGPAGAIADCTTPPGTSVEGGPDPITVLVSYDIDTGIVHVHIQPRSDSFGGNRSLVRYAVALWGNARLTGVKPTNATRQLHVASRQLEVSPGVNSDATSNAARPTDVQLFSVSDPGPVDFEGKPLSGWVEDKAELEGAFPELRSLLSFSHQPISAGIAGPVLPWRDHSVFFFDVELWGGGRYRLTDTKPAPADCPAGAVRPRDSLAEWQAPSATSLSPTFDGVDSVRAHHDNVETFVLGAIVGGALGLFGAGAYELLEVVPLGRRRHHTEEPGEG